MREETLATIRRMQKNEATEHVIYGDLAKRIKGHNGEILARMLSHTAVSFNCLTSRNLM